MSSLCVVELPITVNFIKLLHVTQQYFCGKFLSPATIARTWPTSSCKLLDQT